VRDGGSAFRQCLASVQDQSVPPLELIVIDDGSRDGSGQAAADFGARVLRQEHSLGPARARNAGAALASGDILVFIDADVELHPDTLALIRQRFEKDPTLDAVCGRYDNEPAARAFVSRYRNLLHAYTHMMATGPAGTFWAGCGAIRRPVFEAARGFDPRFTTPSVEDIELGMRLARLGRSLAFDGSIQVKHHKRWTLWSMIRTDVWLRAVPWSHLMMADRKAPASLNLRWSQRASVAAALLWPAALPLHPAAGLALLAAHAGLNLPFLGFLRRTQGLLFAIASWPLHVLHHFYSGAALPLALATFPWRQLAQPAPTLEEGSR
jgi:GT2 family glycosyltransferase